MTSTLFLTYVQEFTCPTLHLGDIVIADNLRGHDVTGVKELSKRCEHTSASSHRIPPGSIPSNN